MLLQESLYRSKIVPLTKDDLFHFSITIGLLIYFFCILAVLLNTIAHVKTNIIMFSVNESMSSKLGNLQKLRLLLKPGPGP